MTRIWILTRSRVGDLKQMETLAAALGADTTIKQIAFHTSLPSRLPFLSRILLRRTSSDPLLPPWPDLVLCAEAATGPIALAVRASSGGRTIAICLGRPRGRFSAFDLIVSTPQYLLPSTENVVRLPLPLHNIDHGAILEAGKRLSAQLSNLPRPWVGVLVGGTSPPDRLDAAAAARLGRAVSEMAKARQASLLVTTSVRTGAGAEAALSTALGKAAFLYPWSKGAANPYLGILGAADELVVTSDSVSMVAEALSTGKAVSIYRLPQRLNSGQKLVSRLFSWAVPNERDTWATKLTGWLFETGLLEVRPDRDRLFAGLVASGRLQWFGEPTTHGDVSPTPADGLALAVSTVQRCLNQRKQDSTSK